MINIYPSFYKKFRCAAGKCPDTCCAKWEIVVDQSSVNFYNRIKTPFGERLRRSITTDSDGDTVFRNVNNRCPFLDENNLCDIHSTLGEEALCETCKKFPRFSTSFGGTREWGLSLACPAACDLILNNDLVLVSEYTDEDPDLNELDADLYTRLREVREDIFVKLKTCSSLSEALSAADEVENLDAGIFKSFEYLTGKGREVFLNINSFAELKLTDEHKRIFAYYIYRYLLASAYDGSVRFAPRLALFAARAIDTVAQNEKIPLSEAAVLFSKEIEYSEENLKIFKSPLTIHKNSV